MKIATWNIERFPASQRVNIINEINKVNADIIVLTETSILVQLENYHTLHTTTLYNSYDKQAYQEHENRASIYSKYPIVKKHNTKDNYTSCCVDIETPLGIITIYASIIGCLGHKKPYFQRDLNNQLEDYENIFPNCEHIAIIGDFNITFNGQAWPSKTALQIINEAFDNYNLINTTIEIEKNVEHIVLSKGLITKPRIALFTWNNTLAYSDHKGVGIEI